MKIFKAHNFMSPIYWDTTTETPKQEEGFSASEGKNIELSDHHHLELIKIISPLIRQGVVTIELMDKTSRFFDKTTYNRVLKSYEEHYSRFGGSININDWVRQDKVLRDHFIFPKVASSESYLVKLCKAIACLHNAIASKIGGRYPKDIETMFNRSLRYKTNPITFQFGSGGQEWTQTFNNELLWAWFCMLNEKWGSDIPLCQNPSCNKPIVGKRVDAKTCSDYCRVRLNSLKREKKI